MQVHARTCIWEMKPLSCLSELRLRRGSREKSSFGGKSHQCSYNSPVLGENQGSGLASPSLCCHDVSQLLPSAFPSRMSNSAVITFNESQALSQLPI